MKIRFVKPLPRWDHVIPAGFVLDAPEGFARKMVKSGRAVPASGPCPSLEDVDRQDTEEDTEEAGIPENPENAEKSSSAETDMEKGPRKRPVRKKDGPA